MNSFPPTLEKRVTVSVTPAPDVALVIWMSLLIDMFTILKDI